MTYEGIAQDDTLQSPSFIYHSIEDFELVKSLKGFRPMPLTSKVTAILLHFGYVASDFRKNQIQGFRPEILLIYRSNGH
jgi:hypothetical protein